MKQNILKNFNFQGKACSVSFVETVIVNSKVECDVYTFLEDKTKDLGIIKIRPGGKTPLQKVLKGKKTIEGYVSGKGKFLLIKANGKERKYLVENKTEKSLSITVRINEMMQWQAEKDCQLIVYEICIPPYKDGRYKNINETFYKEEKLALEAIKEFEKDRKAGKLLTGTKAEDLFNLEKVC